MKNSRGGGEDKDKTCSRGEASVEELVESIDWT